MLQQQSRAPAKQKRGGGSNATGGAPDKQARLGNAAIAERSGSGGADAGVSNDEAMGWLSTEESMGSREPDRAVDKRGISRPDAAPTGGEFGALIGTGSTVPLYSGETGRSGKFTVPNGTGCEVLDAGTGSRIKVKVRVGTEGKEGWVSKAYFSDQPTLGDDHDTKGLKDDLVYSKIEGDHTPKNPTGKDTAQGGLGDCYLIAAMAAVANASPNVIKEGIKYDAKKKTYSVRFYEEEGWGGTRKPVWIEVDSYLPTSSSNRADPKYAGDQGGPMWSAIVEKAYAKWKGGYDKIGDGGYGEQTMEELTGGESRSKSPASMKPDEVIPFFTQAKKDGKAIYAAVKGSKASDTQTPFTGSADGPYTANFKMGHRWDNIVPGSVRIKDKERKDVSIYDQGSEHDPKGKLAGTGVKEGEVEYKANKATLTFNAGKGPAKPENLTANFNFKGCYNPDKILVANHAYAFDDVVSGGKELQFYNPWGTWQPKPITPAEFLDAFSTISLNTPPKTADQS